MYRRVFLTAVLAAVPSAAYAGDKPVYAPAPAWIKAAPPVDTTAAKDDAPVFVLLDAQQLLKDGETFGYVDTVARIANAQMLDASGTIKLPWQPDKGDLIIHKVEIIRGAERVDLLAGGQRFQVLQREEQLEKRMLNGVLTATMAVEGLRIGDMLHVAFSITRADPALKGEIQIISPIPAEPFRAQFARSRMIWPVGKKVQWKVNVAGVTPQETTANGYHEVTITLPVPKPAELPDDAPARYKLPPLFEAGSFADWAAVSAIMAPLYQTEGLITPGSPLAGEVAAITAKQADPLRRTAEALALVQGKIRYLFKGMEGGNYVPQSPAQTWTLRYGDCKAKTLLLLAVLHQMGIDAEAVLANSQFGDGLPSRLPTPGAFDHVFVRATVGGQVLWLDGTDSGTQLADIGDTPPLGYVLPIRASGAALLSIPKRAGARANVLASIDLDQSAGVNFPAPFKMSFTVRGQLVQLFKSVQVQADKDQLTKMTVKLLGDYLESPWVVTRGLTFDDAAGTATLNATGISYPDWSRENERYRSTLDATVTGLTFDPDRSRAAWRDIPVSTGVADHLIVHTKLTLPDGGRGYTIEGNAALNDTLAGRVIDRKAILASGLLTIDTDVKTPGDEIAVADIGATRQKLAQAKQHLLRVVAPADLAPSWQIAMTARRTRGFDKILALYRQSIVDEPSKAEPLTNRAWFLDRIYDRRGAIADLTSALAIEPTVDSYLWRGRLLADLGERDKAIADALEARKIDPASALATSRLANLYADKGDTSGALALLDARIDEGGKDKTDFMSSKASILGKAGDKDAALATIDAALVAKPGNPGLLNMRCWLKATLGVMLDTALKDCTKSIELSESTADVLDSRAMAYFRLDRTEDALADLNAALEQAPDQSGSLFMRAIIRKRAGQTAAAEADLAAARMISPLIDELYAKYGVKP